MKLKKVSTNPNFAQLEEEILEFWRKNDTFIASIEKNSPDKTFSFYDGPPFATGLPHYGHIVPGTLKDIFPRYKTMRGWRVERKFGWDCHGLPLEYEMEKELKISGKKEIEKMGVDKFNEACRKTVLRYAAEWERIIGRLGRWVDFKNDYKTMDVNFMESVWWVFKTLYDQKLVFQGYKSMHICPRCATTLSNFEVTLNYKDKEDISLYVLFKVVKLPETYFLAWTTTPWTLPGNVLLAINPSLAYVEAVWQGKKLILSEKSYVELAKEISFQAVKKIEIKEFLGMEYLPLYNVELPKNETEKKKYQVVVADFVSNDEGTGVVHVAPAFGEDDLSLGQKENSLFIQHVNIEGEINDCLPYYSGESVFSFNKKAVEYLSGRGSVFLAKKIIHSYPHCWRCDTPLLNYAARSWFVAVSQFKDQLVKNNKTIHWVPHHIGIGRFGNWLEQARDWSISRARYWGTPLPVWICDKCQDKKVFGSKIELEKATRSKLADLHKHFVDQLFFPCSCGGMYRRVPEVFDCWFESGSMPYGSNHFPFENEQKFRTNHPADFISEGIDQTRGWFYTLHVLSTAIFGKPAFKNCIVHGIVLAEDGQKMSKRKKNYPDPLVIVAKYGADALRFFLMNSTVIKGEDICFSEKGVADVVRTIFLPLWNIYAFLQTNLEITSFELQDENLEVKPTGKFHLLDRWILSRLANLTLKMTEKMEEYDVYETLKPVRTFVEDFSTWYIRRSRGRVDSFDFFKTTTKVLLTLAKLLAPFVPFFAESLWLNFGFSQSVHLQTWPEVDHNTIDNVLEEKMQQIRKLAEVGNAQRKKLQLKVRQPLASMTVHNFELAAKDQEYLFLLKEELNVKNILFVKDDSEPLSVDFDTNITWELKQEGEARDIIRILQDLRKKENCSLTEEVSAEISCQVPAGFEEYIKKKVLLKSLTVGKENKIIRHHG